MDARRRKVAAGGAGAAALVAAAVVAVVALTGGAAAVACSSLASAVAAASPGSTVAVAGGPCAIQATLSGISKNPPVKVVPADQGNPPVFRGSGQRGYPAVFVVKSNGITFTDGLVFTNPAGVGLQVEQSQNITLAKSRVVGNGEFGVLVQTLAGTPDSSNVVIEANEFAGNGADRSLDPHSPQGNGLHSIYYGGQFGRTVGGAIRNNWVHDSANGMAIQIGPTAIGLVVANNTIQRVPYSTGTGSHIDYFACVGTFGTSTGIQIRNNVCQDSGGWGTTSAGSNLQATVSSNVADRVAVSPSFRSVYGTKTTATVSGNWDENLGDLKLASSGVPAGDSPLVGKADPAYLPAVDFNGTARTAKTVGAFEPTSAPPPPPPPPPPPADSLPLTVASEDSNSLTVTWAQPSGAYGYVFLRDGLRVSNTFNPNQTTATFSKRSGQHRYEVVAISNLASGSVTR